MRRLRPLSEAECYTRCYGGWEQTVRIVSPAAGRRSGSRAAASDSVRRLFEERLDARRAAPAAA